jgi:hypothetical protein
VLAALHFSANTAVLRGSREARSDYASRMEHTNFQICVLGAGHLAAAVRMRLRLLSPLAANDCTGVCVPDLFLACSDFENAMLRSSLAVRVGSDRSSILFACLETRAVRVGPLVSSHDERCVRYLTRSWDFGLNNIRASVTPLADTTAMGVAQIGATIVVRELAKLLASGTEIDSPSAESGSWRSQSVWHPATLG